MFSDTCRFLVYTLCFYCISPFVSADRLSLPAIEISNVEKSLLNSVINVEGRLLAAGEHGVIIYSDDKGESWRQAKNPTSVMLTAMHFSTNSVGWAVGHDGLMLQSQNGGEHWEQVLSGNELNQLRVEVLEQALQKNDDALNEELRETLEILLDDALFALEEADLSPLLDVLFINEQKGFAIGAYGMMVSTDDGGKSWVYKGHHLPNPDGFHLNSMSQLNNGDLLIAGESGLVLISTDQGDSWNLVDSPYEGSFFTSIETDAVYLFGLRGNGFEFDSESRSWRTLSLPTRSTITSATDYKQQAVLVGQGGVVLHQKGDSFEMASKRGLGGFSSATIVDNTLVAVGTQGVERISLEGSIQ